VRHIGQIAYGRADQRQQTGFGIFWGIRHGRF
jgi:hypothetical protein